MKKTLLLTLFLLWLPGIYFLAADSYTRITITPTLTDLVGKVCFAGEAPRVSPDGEKVAYLLRVVNWEKNQFEQHCYVYNKSQNSSRPLTKSGSVRNLRWLDHDTLAFLNMGQVWISDIPGQKEQQVTDHKGGIYSFEIFDSKGIIFLAGSRGYIGKRFRDGYFGDVEYVEHEESDLALYYTHVRGRDEPGRKKPFVSRNKTKEAASPVLEITKSLDKSFTIQEFVVSPAGQSVYVNCLPAGTHVYWKNNLVFQVKLNRRELLVEKVSQLKLPSYTEIAVVSPDGTHALVRSWGKDAKIYNLEDLFIVDLRYPQDVKLGSSLSAKLDRQPISIHWVNRGIFISCWNRTRIDIVKLSKNGQTRILDLEGIFPRRNFDISADGHIVFVGGNAVKLFELYTTKVDRRGRVSRPVQVTHIGSAYQSWDWGTVETLRWQSTDGVEIEGILRKPTSFEPTNKYPLLFLLHGGPTWADLEFLEDRMELYYYPVIQLLGKGVLVLKPNYRGSRGYGHKFAAEKAGKNHGYVSLWDLEGAIESLSSKGFVDTTRVGCMGWSHGGYISAFVASHSAKFKAVSVGAGTSDWTTYAVNSDICFEITKDYLSYSPFQPDQTVYRLSAPLSKISRATSPMLLQHGRNDPVSPLQNSKELFRGLKDRGVQVAFFIFNNMGHGISSPKENRAVMRQNLSWFGHFLLGEELDFFKID